jgi:hypothetical protein
MLPPDPRLPALDLLQGESMPINVLRSAALLSAPTAIVRVPAPRAVL